MRARFEAALLRAMATGEDADREAVLRLYDAAVEPSNARELAAWHEGRAAGFEAVARVIQDPHARAVRELADRERAEAAACRGKAGDGC